MSSIYDKLHALREDYDNAPLRRSDMQPCPIEQFSRWLEEAVQAQVYDPNACTLSTVDPESQPFSRGVLLKGIDEENFVFYTNYNSRKAAQLERNPKACLHFPWFALQRQVLITGVVEKVEDELAEEYFRSRPSSSKLGAWASSQSDPLDSRETLETAFLEAKEKWGEDPPKPPHWGGFRLSPDSIEFWQGGPGRLHDRFLYEKQAQGWSLQRLNP
tara:strand:- start:122 stop:769 length:648 start_codon:yes stop_codon:yes gene_type:complete